MQNYCNIVKNKLNMHIRSMEKNVSNFVVDPKRDFVRKSELSFSKTLKFILGMGSQTLGKELMEFYDFNPKMVSVSAIVQRRSKILPAAFQYLFHEFNNEFFQTNFFHGYRLYAVDGSDIHIPTIPDDKETFYCANDDSKGYNLMHLTAIHVCIAFFRCSNVSPSHLEKLIARNKCPVRPDRNAFRKTRYHSAIPFNYRLS